MPKEKRSDGRYRTSIYLGKDENGKAKYKYLYAKTEKELRQKEREFLNQMQKGVDIATMDDTFEQWASRLLSNRKSTMAERELATLEARLRPFREAVGNLKLKVITQLQLQPIVDQLFERNPTTGKQTGKRTLQRYIRCCSAVFEFAMENRSCDFNPCNFLTVNRAATVTERRMLTPTERKWIEEFEHPMKPAAMLMMYSGLRRGEATALLWSDIDFEKNTITVNKSYNYDTESIKTPKTDAGVRVVFVPSKLTNYLRTLPKRSALVCTNEKGERMTKANWVSMWNDYLIQLNYRYGKRISDTGSLLLIEPFTPHCLRHTFCSIMYEAGIDVLTAKEQMGHSDVKTTLGVYTHLDRTHKTRNLEKLEQYVSGDKNQVCGSACGSNMP